MRSARGRYPRCAGGVGYSTGGLVSYGASAWGSAELEPDGATPSGAQEPRVLEAEATGGVVGRDIEERGAPAPLLPLDWQNMQEMEVVTPPRREVNGQGASGLLGLGYLRGGHE